MRDIFKRGCIVIITILTVMAVFVYYAAEKSGMFIDEIYSYGLSNSEYTPFLVNLKDKNVIDTVFTADEFADYVTVDGDEGFDLGSVYYNQTKDVHPPLYYLLLNAASSVARGSFTKWTGLALNFVFYLLNLVCLYKLAAKLFGNMHTAVYTMILYGFSTMGLSTALMIRMYCLLTLLSVELLYLLVSYSENKKWYTALCVGLVIFAGLMTHYYFVIYAFFACLAFLIRFIRERDLRKCIGFFVPAVAGVVGMTAVFPAVIDHLFADKLVSGSSAYNNLINPLVYPKKIAKYCIDVVVQMPVTVLSAVVFLVIAFCIFRKNGAGLKKYLADSKICVVMLPVAAAFVLSAIISPVHSERYIYNIAPFFALFASYMIDAVSKNREHTSFVGVTKRISLVLVSASVVCAMLIQPSYVYKEHAAYNEAVRGYSDSPCVYFNDNYNAPLTQDLIQLIEFDEVFVTDSAESPKLSEYLAEKGDHESIVVYIDVSEFWSSGFDSGEVLDKLVENTEYNSYELLYGHGLSEAYVVKK